MCMGSMHRIISGYAWWTPSKDSTAASFETIKARPKSQLLHISMVAINDKHDPKKDFLIEMIHNLILITMQQLMQQQ